MIRYIPVRKLAFFIANNMGQEKKIIYFLITLFVLSSGWLFWVNERGMDPNYQKNWWVVYFQDPKSENLNFTIENHSDKNNFRWEVLSGGSILQSAEFAIPKGQSKGFLVNVPNREDKITVSVSDGEKKKDIYKNFTR